LILTENLCCSSLFIEDIKLHWQPSHIYARLLIVYCTLLTPAALKSETGVVILQYHHVSEKTPDITSIAPDKFQRHIEAIINQGYEVVPLDEVVFSLKKRERLPNKAVAITFDDAYKNIFTNAYPILKRYNLPFTIFVATDYVSSDSNQFLSWAEIREMESNGALIANHTANHTHLLRRLPAESRDQWHIRVKNEILDAENILAMNLKYEPANLYSNKLLAYPYGEYDTDVQNIAENLGYIAFGQQSGAAGYHSDFSALPRFPLSGKYSDQASFEVKLATLPLPIKNSRRNPLLPIKETMPILELNFIPSDLDLSRLNCFGPHGALDIKLVNNRSITTYSGLPLPIGRSRYNCTIPVPDIEKERFYWFSQLWIRKNTDGSWYPEH
jgi:biofilm PGA synthesis lipoprotein PgaB